MLKKTLRDVGLAEGRPFDKALADRAEQELKRQYINRSMYAAQVVTTVTPSERNRVNLNFNVIEGDVAKIKDIRIVGNQAFSESTLRDLFDLDTGGFMSWYTKSDRYSRAKLNADLETLRSYYLTRGYLEFKVDSTQVAISPDKQDMSMTINITEGKRFVVSSVALQGEYLGKEDEFKTMVAMRPGEAYNAEDVSKTVKAFTDYFGAFGYAFAQVEATPEYRPGQQSRGLCVACPACPPRVCPPDQRRRQQPHTRRSDSPGVSSAGVGLVRQRSHPSVARPGGPPGLFHRGGHRYRSLCQAPTTRST